MSYLPRPEAERVEQDVDEIYALAAEDLQRADTPGERRKAFRLSLLRAYEAGVDAQREVLQTFAHERPTPVPPPPARDPEDPGTVPLGRPRTASPPHAYSPSGHPREPKKG
jgi:hypothetical protein